MPDHVMSSEPAPALLPDEAPFDRLRAWLAEAQASEVNDANAMTLATVDADGRPSARIVLLKGIDEGLTFFTNKQSRKGSELTRNRHAALLFHWKSLRRQVRVEGLVGDVTDAEADAYFATRARISRLGAAASDQSRPLPDRATLERRVADLDARYPDDIPRPAHWSGYRLRPERFEFWQERPFRLHERSVMTRAESGTCWRVQALYP